MPAYEARVPGYSSGPDAAPFRGAVFRRNPSAGPQALPGSSGGPGTVMVVAPLVGLCGAGRKRLVEHEER
jgi:hypothetical protein